MPITITPGDLTNPTVIQLLTTHITTALAETGRDSAHALDISALQAPDIQFWTAWNNEQLLAIGALRQISSQLGEVKSMHTAQAARRSGAGSAMLGHIIDTAKAMGLSRLALETGSWNYFMPARAFYRRHGFVECAPFGDYVEGANSVFMMLELR
jgi:putative acetyltransferase